jgi:hypothetical protein
LHERAVGKHDVEREHIVDREPSLRVRFPIPAEVSPATPVVEMIPNGAARLNAPVA